MNSKSSSIDVNLEDTRPTKNVGELVSEWVKDKQVYRGASILLVNIYVCDYVIIQNNKFPIFYAFLEITK